MRQRRPNTEKARARDAIHSAVARIPGARVKSIALGSCAFLTCYAPNTLYPVQVNIHYHETRDAEAIIRHALAPWLDHAGAGV